MSTAVATSLYVVFKVAGSDYVLPAADVVQMETFTGATAVPGAPPWVAGLVQVRGRVVPVVDLRVRFGLPPAPTTLDSRIVVVASGGRTVALLADSAREVLRLPEGALEAPPETVTQHGRGFVRSLASVGGRLVQVVDFARIVGEERMHGE